MREGSVELDVSLQEVPSKEAVVFYNPVMKLNRDINVLFLNAIGRKLYCADVLAGSGVRALRLKKEAGQDVVANDVNPDAFKSIKRNARLNRIRLEAHNKEGSRFLLESEGFDYIDIDPFGSPNPWLDAAVKRVSRGGFLAVTATDTSALAGSHPKACVRKYWANPVRNHCMHEIGMRILVRKVQLIGAQYSKALIPVFCNATQHYYRIYFECRKGKSAVDEIMKQHKRLSFRKQEISVSPCGVVGPLWIGRLWNRSIVRKMLSAADGDAGELIGMIYSESAVPVLGIFEYYKMCSDLKMSVPSREKIIAALKKKGFKASPTHFDYRCLRTDATPKQLRAVLSRLARS